MIYISPDRTNYKNLPDHTVSNDIESLTGADLLISNFPLSFDENTLPSHIKTQGLFVQIKIGYDILSFDGLKSSIARMQKCQIPQQQAILLFVGQDWQDDNGLLRIKKQATYGDATYKTFIKLKAKWRARYGTVDWINSIDQLPAWIEAQEEALQDIKNEGPRELYPTRPLPQFEPDDIWQEVKEVDKNDPRYFMCAGVDGFGPGLANNLKDYIAEELPHLQESGYYYLKTLTDENEKGKPVHKVKGWGDKSRKKLREMLGLIPGYNLHIKHLDDDSGFINGWYGFGRNFMEMLDEGEKPKDAFNNLMKQADEFFKE